MFDLESSCFSDSRTDCREHRQVSWLALRARTLWSILVLRRHQHGAISKDGEQSIGELGHLSSLRATSPID